MMRALTLLLMLSLLGCEGGREASVVDTGSRTSNTEGVWLAGDMHVHTDHSSDGSGPRQGADQRGPGNVSVADQIGQGELNGLHWLPITDHRTYVQHYDPLWESHQLLLIPGEEANGSPHANPIGAVDTIVQGSVPEGRPAWSRLQTSIWDAHSQGASWQHNHPDGGHLDENLMPNENANAIGGDLVEGWNSYSGIERSMAYAEHQWNAGFRFGISGSSDSHFREIWAFMAPGLPATRVFAPAWTERGIIQGLRSGRTTATASETRSPHVFLDADFDGDGIYEAVAGDEIVVTPGTPGRLRISVANAAPGGTNVHFYVAPDGRVAGPEQEFLLTAIEQSFELEISAPAEPAWYYAEVRGVGEPHSIDLDARSDPERLHFDQLLVDERRAISSPIFVGPVLAEPRPAQGLPAPLKTDDGARQVHGEVGAFAGFPDVAVSGGLSHIVAEQHGVGSTQVIYRRVDGERVAAPVVLAPASQSARFPKVAAMGERLWVVWQDERAGQIPRRPAIYARESRDGGQSWQPEQLLRALNGRAEHPDLALGKNGDPLVVWQEITADGAFDVMFLNLASEGEPTNLSRAGKTINPADPSDTRSARHPASLWPRIAVGPAGEVAVAFHDNRTDPDPGWTGAVFVGEDNATEFDNWEVRVTVQVQGEWSDLAILGDGGRADRHADLVFAADGQLVVAWDSKEIRGSGANTAIYSSVSDDGGQSWSAPQTVAEDPQMMSQYPRLGRATDGTVQAVWYDNRARDWRWKIMTARFAAGAWDGGQLIAAPANNTWPAVADGQIVFASDRAARRLQRDSTQQIFLLP